jgi:hypothetical protein
LTEERDHVRLHIESRCIKKNRQDNSRYPVGPYFELAYLMNIRLPAYGRSLAEGRPTEVLNHPDVISAYLGGTKLAQAQPPRESAPRDSASTAPDNRPK